MSDFVSVRKSIKIQAKNHHFRYYFTIKRELIAQLPLLSTRKPSIHILFLQTLQQTQRDDF